VTTIRWTRACSILVALAGTACGSDSDSGSEGGAGSTSSDPTCFAGSIELTETKRTDSPSFNTLLLDFDAKNTSSSDYDIMKGSKAILLDFVVTTTDGTEYESEAPLTAAKIDAGATAAVVAMAEYGAGKTFESYTVSLRCR
jgi:hypothetical protein